jgi:putative peptide zinc metalloprotease protein
MYIELILASLATFVWWFTTTGLLNHLALNVMFICSISTIVFNANPLMRYDGYYILIDLVEVPNLDQKSNQVLQHALGHWLLGFDAPRQPWLSGWRELWYAAYAVAAMVYRWVVFASILLFLHSFFEPYRLEVLAQLLGIVSIVGLIGVPLWRLFKFLNVPGRGEQMEGRRFRISLGVLAMLVLAALLIPLPHRAWGTLELKPLDPQHVFVETPGELVEMLAAPGAKVQPGAPLARLRNLDLEFEVARLRAQQAQYEAQRAGLMHRRALEPEVGRQIPELETSLAAVVEQLQQKRQQLERLTLYATRAGTVMLAPPKPRSPNTPGELPTWSGTPFEPRNRGCFLETGTLLCQVGDPTQFEASIVLDQADVPLVHEGQDVAIKLDEDPTRTIWSTLREVAHSDVKISPRHLSNKVGGELATKTDAAGVERPLSVSYQARAPIASEPGALREGFRGRAKIYASWQTPASQFWRWFSQTFHFRL